MLKTLYKRISHYSLSHSQYLLCLLMIFLIFAFFRFYDVHLRIPFAWDQEQFSTQIRDIMRDNKFTLLGPRVIDDNGFFLAPYFTYLLIPFYYITGLSPIALILFIVSVNLAFFCLSAYVVSKLFSMRHSLLFLLIWSLNPLLIRYDIIPWWPILIPLGVIMVWYILDQILTSPKNPIFWSVLGLSIGFFCNMHFQFIFIGMFAFFYLIAGFRQHLITYWSGIVIASVSFFIMFTPLILFDIRHENLNYTLFSTFFTERVTDDLPYLHAWQPVFANVLRSFIGLSYPVMTIIFFTLMFLLLLFLIKKNTNHRRTFYIASASLLIITAIGFSLYGRRPSEYYFIYFMPFIFVALIDGVLTLKIKHLLPAVALALMIINFTELRNVMKEDSFGLYYKNEVVKQMIPYASDKRVNVSYDVPYGLNNGYGYLIDYHGINMTGDPADPLIQIHIPPQKGDIIVKNIGLYIPPELQK